MAHMEAMVSAPLNSPRHTNKTTLVNVPVRGLLISPHTGLLLVCVRRYEVLPELRKRAVIRDASRLIWEEGKVAYPGEYKTVDTGSLVPQPCTAHTFNFASLFRFISNVNLHNYRQRRKL